MPQLDKLSFIPQVFWLIIFFLGLYVLVVEVILPKLHTIFYVRVLKTLMHNSRIVALENEKATNKIYEILFKKLFKNTDLFSEYFLRYNNITAHTYGSDYVSALKDLRVNSALELENLYYKILIQKQLTQNCIQK